jgi:lipoate-protein ligase A
MSATLDLLPPRTGGAAENMAMDFLLLQRYPRPGAARFRHYGWHRPAFTFGNALKFSCVRTQWPADGHFDVCRRPTGGGVVDHRNDWTYALVIPRGHRLEDLRATQSYREIHEALAAALRAQGVAAVTKQTADPAEEPAGACFQRAEIYDVVHEGSGDKIAGAAQKRNKHGLLFQGSIWRPACDAPSSADATKGQAVDWEIFGEDFAARIAAALGGEAAATPWPEFAEDELAALVEHYSSSQWNEFR